MTDTPPRLSTPLIIAVAVIFAVTDIAIVLVLLFTPADRDALSVVTPLLTSLGGVIATLFAVDRRVGSVENKVDYMVNGGTDAKIRAGIADVVKPEFLRDDAADQLEADYEHREAAPAKMKRGARK